MTHSVLFLSNTTTLDLYTHVQCLPFFVQCPEDAPHHQIEQARTLLSSLFDGLVKGYPSDSCFLEANVIFATDSFPHYCANQYKSNSHVLHCQAQIQRRDTVKSLFHIQKTSDETKFRTLFPCCCSHESSGCRNLRRTASFLKAQTRRKLRRG